MIIGRAIKKKFLDKNVAAPAEKNTKQMNITFAINAAAINGLSIALVCKCIVALFDTGQNNVLTKPAATVFKKLSFIAKIASKNAENNIDNATILGFVKKACSNGIRCMTKFGRDKRSA